MPARWDTCLNPVAETVTWWHSVAMWLSWRRTTCVQKRWRGESCALAGDHPLCFLLASFGTVWCSWIAPSFFQVITWCFFFVFFFMCVCVFFKSLHFSARKIKTLSPDYSSFTWNPDSDSAQSNSFFSVSTVQRDFPFFLCVPWGIWRRIKIRTRHHNRSLENFSRTLELGFGHWADQQLCCPSVSHNIHSTL